MTVVIVYSIEGKSCVSSRSVARNLIHVFFFMYYMTVIVILYIFGLIQSAVLYNWRHAQYEIICVRQRS